MLFVKRTVTEHGLLSSQINLLGRGSFKRADYLMSMEPSRELCRCLAPNKNVFIVDSLPLQYCSIMDKYLIKSYNFDWDEYDIVIVVSDFGCLNFQI